MDRVESHHESPTATCPPGIIDLFWLAARNAFGENSEHYRLLRLMLYGASFKYCPPDGLFVYVPDVAGERRSAATLCVVNFGYEVNKEFAALRPSLRVYFMSESDREG